MDAPFTLPFDTFWEWITGHPNCIVRAGTPEAVVYDDEDLHWIFAAEGESTLLVQVLRGKRLVGELFIEPEPVSYVQALPQENEDEHVFELVSESGSERFSAYFFVLIHGVDVEGEESAARVH